MGAYVAGNLEHPYEPLTESAPLAWSLAPQLCPGDPASSDTCLWYHQVWQYLRLLGIITSIRTNTDFLLDTFRALSVTHPRVLIAASADYEMLAHLKHAFGDRPLEVTLVDRCQTSLRLNQWYADRTGIGLTVLCADAISVTTDRPFDLVCTHNFVGRFDADARVRLVTHWHRLLRPGGVVVTTQRIRPNSREARTAYTREEALEVADRTAAAARSFGARLGVEPDALHRAVVEYALRKTSHVLTSPRDLASTFERTGFEVAVADEGGGSLEREHDRPSSQAGRDTYRTRLVAIKR
jgi:SAM-dependent methyltransferase